MENTQESKINIEEENKILIEELESVKIKYSTLETKYNALLSKLEDNSISPVVEKTTGLEFTFREKKYKFSDDAPKNILFMGESYTQEELVKDEDILLFLIGNKSTLIEKL